MPSYELLDSNLVPVEDGFETVESAADYVINFYVSEKPYVIRQGEKVVAIVWRDVVYYPKETDNA